MTVWISLRKTYKMWVVNRLSYDVATKQYRIIATTLPSIQFMYGLVQTILGMYKQ